MKSCQWCNAPFEAEVSYQIYCSVFCREQSTKEKMADKYAITRRNRRVGKNRSCKQCNTLLSAYNDDPLCSACTVNPLDVSKTLREIKRLARGQAELD